MGNIQEIPPSVLESWPEPNLVNPTRRSWMPAFALIWQIASTILVWGRFYLRVRRLAGPFGYDDVFMLIAWMSSVAFTACAWHLTTHLGVDRHTWDVPITLFSDAALFAWILQVLMLFGSGATKASVLLFYRRLVTGTLARRWKLAIYFALAFHAAYLIGNTLGYFLICRPLRAYWMSFDYEWIVENHSYTCADAQALNPVVGVLSIVSDVYAVVLPFVILHYYTLDVPRSQRIGLNIIFATGLLVAGAGVGRTYYLIKLGKTYDTSWTGFDLLVWTIVELQLGIICACAPSLRAFFRRYLSGLLSRTFGSSSGKSKSRNGRSTRSDPSDSGGRENSAAPAVPAMKGVEEIDMQVLTGRDSESSSEIDDAQMQGADGRVRPASPAATYASRSTRGGREGREVRRWNSGHSVPCSSKQSAEGGITRAQETHSPV